MCQIKKKKEWKNPLNRIKLKRYKIVNNRQKGGLLCLQDNYNISKYYFQYWLTRYDSNIDYKDSKSFVLPIKLRVNKRQDKLVYRSLYNEPLCQ